ncbi:hypothetical protein [Paenibacillus xylanivorans]|uniref:hypothetical protein n=1 Tax=Paenibacillus xylanivorans TaxID=1705561 RepID=UPI001364DC17|nr:hypothetical protein [Paenibacillus xylanivorans]
MNREMIQIIFRESAGNDKLVQKARKARRPCSIRFDVLRADTSKPFFVLYT